MKKPKGEWKQISGRWFKKRLRIEWQPFVVMVCKVCSQEFLTRHNSATCSPSCRAKLRWSKTTPEERQVKKFKTARGYIYKRTDEGKYVGEHRLIMQGHIGRQLDSSEHVHHINGNRSDNRIKNLVLLSRSDHNILHKGKQVKSFKREKSGKFTTK